MPPKDHQLYEDIGYIKAQVEKIDELDSRLRNVEKKVSNILGWASGAGAVAGLAFTFVKDWFVGNK